MEKPEGGCRATALFFYLLLVSLSVVAAPATAYGQTAVATMVRCPYIGGCRAVIRDFVPAPDASPWAQVNWYWKEVRAVFVKNLKNNPNEKMDSFVRKTDKLIRDSTLRSFLRNPPEARQSLVQEIDGWIQQPPLDKKGRPLKVSGPLTKLKGNLGALIPPTGFLVSAKDLKSKK